MSRENAVDLDDLLIKTSRTFAISIPLLQGPLRREVTLSYLLLRIADTLEDAAAWSPELRIRGLEDFARLVEVAEAGELSGELIRSHVERWLEEPPTDHDGYLELLRATEEVFADFQGLAVESRRVVGREVRRTARGMAQIVREVADAGGRLELQSVEALRDYCYVVAGIVGELLTELFLLAEPELSRVAEPLRRRAPLFGEALQLVNILKDAADDAEEGRSFLPEAALAEAFALARSDLDVARAYVGIVHGASGSRGVVSFIALPVLLAVATLEVVESHGAGAKVSRTEVALVTQQMNESLDRDDCPV